MSNTISWQAAVPEDAARFDIYSAPASGLEFVLLLSFAAKTPAYYDEPTDTYTYIDEQGGETALYNVKEYDVTGVLIAESGPFLPQVNQAANLITRVKVDTNYGGTDALRYVAGGAGVAQAKIWIYKKPDYDRNRTETPLYAVETANDGRWATPVYLEPGFTYTLVFSKEGSYGPNLVNIVV